MERTARSTRQATAIPRWILGVVATGAIAAALGCSKLPPGRSSIDSVRVLNAKALAHGDIEDQLATQPSSKFLFLFQGVAYDYAIYDEAVLQRDMARVERIYRSKGFFDAHARVGRVEQRHAGHVRVEIVVDEGPPALNRDVKVVGVEGLPREVADGVTSAARRALRRGDRFDEKAYDGARAALKEYLTDHGYAWATVEAQAEVDVGTHTVDYGFSVAAGPPAVFGPIAIAGLDPDGAGPRQQEIPEAAIRRAIDISPGSAYSTAEIASATQAVLDLGVFSAVSIVPELADPPPPGRQVPLTVKVEPTRLRQITLGGGVEIDAIKTDVHLVAGWEDHNLMHRLTSFSATFKPGVVLYPVRIDDLRGPISPLLEERLKLQLRQPGFLEARTTGFVRPERSEE